MDTNLARETILLERVTTSLVRVTIPLVKEAILLERAVIHLAKADTTAEKIPMVVRAETRVDIRGEAVTAHA